MNTTLGHTVPTFSNSEIYKSLIALCPDLLSKGVYEYIININEYCRFSLELEDKTPFYSRYKMEVTDSNAAMFEMAVRVYPNQQTAYAITLEQYGRVQKQSIADDGCWNWADHDEINRFLQDWLEICLDSKPGPVATLYMSQAKNGLGCIA